MPTFFRYDGISRAGMVLRMFNKVRGMNFVMKKIDIFHEKTQVAYSRKTCLTGRRTEDSLKMVGRASSYDYRCNVLPATLIRHQV